MLKWDIKVIMMGLNFDVPKFNVAIKGETNIMFSITI